MELLESDSARPSAAEKFSDFPRGQSGGPADKAVELADRRRGRGDGAAKDVAKIAIGRIVVAEPDGIAAIVFAVVVHEFPVPGFQRPGMTDVLDQCLRFLEIGIGQPVEADIDGIQRDDGAGVGIDGIDHKAAVAVQFMAHAPAFAIGLLLWEIAVERSHSRSAPHLPHVCQGPAR